MRYALLLMLLSGRIPPWEKPQQTARALFLENCTVCHTVTQPKSAKIGPSLMRFRKIAPERARPFRDYIFTKVKGGGIKMPAFGDALSDEQIRAVAGFVLGEK